MENAFAYACLKDAFEKKKKIRVVFKDDSIEIFEVPFFKDTPEEPTPYEYCLSPNLPEGKKLLYAKSIELLD